MTQGPEKPNQPGSASATPTGGSEASASGVPQSVPSSGAPAPEKTPWTAYIRPAIWTVASIYVIAFVFLNRDSVQINFIFFSAQVPMIFVLVGMALIGAALYAGVMFMTSRRAKKNAQLAQLQTKNSGK